MASFLDIKRETLSYYENNPDGRAEAPLEVLEKLADLYGADLADFFEEDTNQLKANLAFAFRATDLKENDLIISKYDTNHVDTIVAPCLNNDKLQLISFIRNLVRIFPSSVNCNELEFFDKIWVNFIDNRAKYAFSQNLLTVF